jgi:hypothetical protein
MCVLLRTMAAVPAQFPADAGQGPEFFMCAHELRTLGNLPLQISTVEIQEVGVLFDHGGRR